MQTTIKESIHFKDVGLHTGVPVSMSIHPASADEGISFFRSDLKGQDNRIPARYDRVVPSSLCTRIENDSGASIQTIEHLMGGLAGCGIHNAVIELDGPEVPAMDGSALPFVKELLLRAGVVSLKQPIIVVRVLRRVEVKADGCSASLEPWNNSEMEFRISFPDPIGNQFRSESLANGAIVKRLIDSRTFCLSSQIDGLKRMGLGLGGKRQKNVLVADDIRDLYLDPFRHEDECVRHKMLDAVGDLALAGHPIIGKFTGIRSGHALTNSLLRKLFSDPSAYELVEASKAVASGLPGAGVTISDLPVLH